MTYKKDDLVTAFDKVLEAAIYGDPFFYRGDIIEYTAYHLHMELMRTTPAYAEKFNKASRLKSQLENELGSVDFEVEVDLPKKADQLKAIGSHQSGSKSSLRQDLTYIFETVKLIPLVIRGNLAMDNLRKFALPYIEKEFGRFN